MKFAFLAVSALVLAGASNASASQIKGTPYTFTGSVVSATAGCPYEAKAKLAGYTLINFTNEYVLQGRKYVEKPIIAGPALIFSPGGGARKLTMKIDNLPVHSGAISGKASVVYLPSLGLFNGTYSGLINVSANKSFTMTYTVNYKVNGANCSTKYKLSFDKGLPANLYNLL